MSALIEDDDEETTLRVNPSYASQYEKRKEKEQLSQLKNEYTECMAGSHLYIPARL